AGLALAAGLAVAAFVKAFGITFLALPRSDAAAGAHEAPVAMRVAMVATAAACAALALGASAIVPALAAVAGTLVPAPAPITVDAHPESRFFVRRLRYENRTRFIVDEWLYRPLGRVLRAAARRAAIVQSGSPNLYLAYVLVALLLLLLVA